MEIREPRQRDFMRQWISEYFEDTEVHQSNLDLGSAPLMLLIDMQKGDAMSKFPYLVSRAIHNTSQILEVARSKNIPIIYTIAAYRADLRDRPPSKLTAPRAYTVGTQSVEVVKEVAPTTHDIVLQKTTNSPFVSTHILYHLTHLRIDSIIITGIHTSGCIRATAMDALSYGFRAVIPEECVGDSKGLKPHKANLCDLDIRGVGVVTAAEVATYLNDFQT
ncbi:MAG: isochorismatase family protein [Thaumarchaeota archaeon]|nr:isochorismatase family protein [Nitrososphaerota archaeon]